MYTKLQKIQNELKAPKGQFNTFGKYNYRSCEDILEALKPLLSQHNCTIIISDEIEFVHNRHYVKATVTFVDCDSANSISVSAFAREDETRKGMDGSQITGGSSSYARKYALNGLFCIDDTKDSDTTNTHDKTQKTTSTDTYKCSQCNTQVESRIAKGSMNKYKAILCSADCVAKHHTSKGN